MKINSIGNQSFGARPTDMTLRFLYQVDENNVDAMPIAQKMKKIYVGDVISSKVYPDGKLKVDVFTKSGDHVKSLIKREDGILVSLENLKLISPKRFALRMYSALKKAEAQRSDKQIVADKYKSVFYEC